MSRTDKTSWDQRRGGRTRPCTDMALRTPVGATRVPQMTAMRYGCRAHGCVAIAGMHHPWGTALEQPRKTMPLGSSSGCQDAGK